MQRQTRFTLEQIGDMDDDQLLFWYSGGKSTAAKKQSNAVSVKLDAKKTWAENLAEIQRRKQEWEAANGGKDR